MNEVVRENYTDNYLETPFFSDDGAVGKNTFCISVPNTLYRIPVTVICRGKGKTLLITAGIHSAEYVGIAAANELCQELSPNSLSREIGRVIIAPLINMSGFSHRTMSMVYEDDKNLNRVFPGRLKGTVADRFCYTVTEELLSRADYYIE